MAHSERILIVDDDSDHAAAMTALLNAEGWEVDWAEDGKAGLEKVREEADGDGYALVMTDFRMPEMGGLELLERVHELAPRLPIILMTSFGTANLAIEATRKGAFDYLLKPIKPDDLRQAIGRAVKTSRISGGKRVEVGSSPADAEGDAIIGDSRVMQEVYIELGRIADKNVTVLIRGETGTGKELLARAIWQHSKRADRPFIAVNCAAIPETLLESELFGHEKGSFTGADNRRIGRFEQASGGTLFLDEIGDMPTQTQVKLLRVLQEKVVTRVGGGEEIPVDVRVIAATHIDIEKAIEAGDFREDLYYRLNAAAVTSPPLRERGEDIGLLVDFYLRRYASAFEMETVPKIENAARQQLLTHSWPGNVRELENVVRKALLRSQGYPIVKADIEDLLKARPVELGQTTGPLNVEKRVIDLLEQAEEAGSGNCFAELQEEFERAVYATAIRHAGGNQSKVARWLGVSRVTLREKLDKYELFPKRKKKSAREGGK